jgi:hypothetical protein
MGTNEKCCSSFPLRIDKSKEVTIRPKLARTRMNDPDLVAAQTRKVNRPGSLITDINDKDDYETNHRTHETRNVKQKRCNAQLWGPVHFTDSTDIAEQWSYSTHTDRVTTNHYPFLKFPHHSLQ